MRKCEGYGLRGMLPGAAMLGLMMAGLYWSRTHSYVLFHTLAELFSIVVAAGVFMTAWNARRFHNDSYLTFLGIAFLFVGGLDLVHMLAYKGMPLFPGHDGNLPTQLWIAARYMESLSLLAAPLLIGRHARPSLVLAGFAAAFILLLLAVFRGIFPACFIEGSGLTPFKRISEYIICGILLVGMAELWRRRAALDRHVFGLLLGAMAVTVAQELSFTLYNDLYGAWNFAGHCLKIVACFLVYKAIVQTGLARPYDLLFFDLKQQKELLAVTLASIGDGVIVTDEGGRVTFLNAEAERLTGWRDSEARGQPLPAVFRIVNEHSRQPVENPVEKVLRLGTVVGLANHTVLIARDGRETPIDDSGAPVRTADGAVHGVVLVFRDFSEQKRQQEEIVRAKTELERANAAKDQFIASLSHELRTPLTPVLAAANSVLRDRRLPEDLREDLEMIYRNVGLEVALITDLLDVTRITAGKLMLEKRPVDVAQVLRDAARISSVDLDGRSQTLTIEMADEPYPMEADSTRLHQVFWNLIKNAIKFTPHGGRIAIKASAADQALRITVRDSGVGIDPEALPRIFDRFEQGDAGTTRQFGGLGLGLAIARTIVEMHGGRITAHSEGRGNGSMFTVELPLARHLRIPLPPALREERSPVPADAPGRSLKILLVEDHADTAKLMRRLLAAEGHEVTTANSVAAGLAAAEQASHDVLISDLGLPDGTGLDLMRQLIAGGKRIPAIAVSGYGTAADIQKTREAGFAEHLVKPLSGIDVLLAALARCRPGDR